MLNTVPPKYTPLPILGSHPVSDKTSPPTLGEALYGPNGPASEPQFAKGIDAGKAAPPADSPEGWRRQAEAAFSPSELADIQARFNAAIGTDAEAQEVRRLLSKTGLGNSPAVIRAVSRLLKR